MKACADADQYGGDFTPLAEPILANAGKMLYFLWACAEAK
jgi:hypothetical protein